MSHAKFGHGTEAALWKRHAKSYLPDIAPMYDGNPTTKVERRHRKEWGNVKLKSSCITNRFPQKSLLGRLSIQGVG